MPTSPLRIAFATSDAHPLLTPDDLLAVAALRADGVHVEPAIWSEPTVRWADFDAVVVRSTWDYHHRAEVFRNWIDQLELTKALVWNPASVLRWNMQKTYLRDLDRAGVPVVPTLWLSKGSVVDAAALMAERRWLDAVIKPVVSATAFRTWRVSRDEAAGGEAAARLRELLTTGDVMIQPFIAEIEREGEWSLMFIDGTFSHAVRKRPTAGDFRMQAEFGGTSVAEAPPPGVVGAAERVLAAAPRPWLYARVDGIDTSAGFVLLELEMLEPSLFLGTSDSAVDRFARAIKKVASGSS